MSLFDSALITFTSLFTLLSSNRRPYTLTFVCKHTAVTSKRIRKSTETVTRIHGQYEARSFTFFAPPQDPWGYPFPTLRSPATLVDRCWAAV